MPDYRKWKYNNEVTEYFVEISTKQTIKHSELMRRMETMDLGDAELHLGHVADSAAMNLGCSHLCYSGARAWRHADVRASSCYGGRKQCTAEARAGGRQGHGRLRTIPISLNPLQHIIQCHRNLLLQTLPDLVKLMDSVHGHMTTIAKLQKSISDSEDGPRLPPPKEETLWLELYKFRQAVFLHVLNTGNSLPKSDERPGPHRSILSKCLRRAGESDGRAGGLPVGNDDPRASQIVIYVLNP